MIGRLTKTQAKAGMVVAALCYIHFGISWFYYIDNHIVSLQASGEFLLKMEALTFFAGLSMIVVGLFTLMSVFTWDEKTQWDRIYTLVFIPFIVSLLHCASEVDFVELLRELGALDISSNEVRSAGVFTFSFLASINLSLFFLALYLGHYDGYPVRC